MRKYLYPLVMVVIALAGAAAIVGYSKCEQVGGCYLVTGNDGKRLSTKGSSQVRTTDSP